MRTLAVLAALLGLAACEKSSGGGGGDGARGHADLEDGAVALVEAILAGDEAAAKQLLIAPDQCPTLVKLVPARDPAMCARFVEEMLASLSDWRSELRDDGFEPGSAREGEAPEPAPDEARVVDVMPKGGGDPVEIGAVALDGRYYFILPAAKVEVVD